MGDHCVVCGGTLKWFPDVHAWRHISVPAGTLPHLAVRNERPTEESEHDDVAPTTIGAAGFIADIAESDIDTGMRIVETREQVEARGRALMEVAAAWNREHPYERPRVDVTMPAPLVDPDKLIEHPKPEVIARPAAEDELPAPAKTMMNLLHDNGWEVEAIYARGWRPDRFQRRSHTRLVDVVAIRGRRLAMAEGIVASWERVVDSEDGFKYDSGYWRVPGDTETLSSTELKTKIKVPVMQCSRCGAGFYTHKECS